MRISEGVMNTKLTLSIDETVILEAKQYALIHNTSVPKMVEQFLGSVTAKKKVVLSGVVAELAGVIPDEEYDYQECLEFKYK